VSDTPRPQGPKRRPSRYWKWAAAVVAGAFLVGLALAFFNVTVCDYQLAQNSSAVRVCRHLEITDPPAAAAVVAVVALLGSFFAEISVFGVTVKQKVEQLEERANNLDAEVQQVAEEAERARENSEDLYEALPQEGEPVERATTAAPDSDSLDDLIARYNEIRRTMPSGPRRTAAMDQVFSQMVARLTDVKLFNVSARLQSSNRGERLAAYAYLHANPATEHLDDLVDALVTEDKPYGEYRAALAAERLVQTDPNALNPRLCKRLDDRLREVPGGSDRASVLRRILQYCRR
jgi:hypothetical protein